MAEQVLAQGAGFGDLQTAAAAVDGQVKPGEIGVVRLRVSWVFPGATWTIENALKVAGVQLVAPVTSKPGGIIEIRYRRNPGPLAIVAVLIAVGIAVWVIGWTISKIGDTAPELGVGLILVALALVALSSAGRRRKT